MALASITLDPNAQSYTDDEIVGKVNAAAALITRADAVEIAAVLESATEKLMSNVEQTKLAGIAEGAEVNPADTDALPEGATNKYDTGVPPADLEALPDGATRKAMLDAEKTKLAGIEEGAKDDQDGTEIRDLVVALGDTERQLVLTNPVTGEHKVVSVEVDADLKLKAVYDETPEA